jgi:hypothetical protein
MNIASKTASGEPRPPEAFGVWDYRQGFGDMVLDRVSSFSREIFFMNFLSTKFWGLADLRPWEGRRIMPWLLKKGSKR